MNCTPQGRPSGSYRVLQGQETLVGSVAGIAVAELLVVAPAVSGLQVQRFLHAVAVAEEQLHRQALLRGRCPAEERGVLGHVQHQLHQAEAHFRAHPAPLVGIKVPASRSVRNPPSLGDNTASLGSCGR